MKRSDLTHVIFLVCMKNRLKLHWTEELISWVYDYDTCFFVFFAYDTGSASFFADERKSEVISSVY